MNAPALKAFTVQLHRRGGKTKGRIEVQANCPKHAERVAVAQTIAVSFPGSKPGNWVVDGVTDSSRHPGHKQNATSPRPAGGSGFDDMEDDVPFISASASYDMTSSKARKMARYS